MQTQTITERFGALTEDDKQQFIESIQEAVFHLASCWDALFQAETLLGDACIETDNIQGITGDISDPTEAYELTTDDIIDRMEVLV